MLLPPSTNQMYQGARAAAWFLGIAGLLTIVPGMIHEFLPDGGAGVIAGIDLGIASERTIALFAWAGATQIVWGVLMLAVAIRYQTLVPLVLLLKLFEIALHTFNAWLFKPGGTGHHPPEHYASLVALPLLAMFSALSRRLS